MTTKTLKAWKSAQKEFRLSEENMRALAEVLKVGDSYHRGQHPLNQKTKEAIVEAFSQDKPLCCGQGFEVLEGLGLDDCWATHLNNWAYNNLGCSGYYAPKGKNHELGLRLLREKLTEGSV